MAVWPASPLEAEGDVLDVLVKSWRNKGWEQTDARIWIPAGDSGHRRFTILLASPRANLALRIYNSDAHKMIFLYF